MGLDQYFFERVSTTEDSSEIIYFRKHHGLHNFISSLGYSLENGGYTVLKSEDLGKIAKYLIRENYWAKKVDESDTLPTDNFLRSVGVLYYMAAMKKGLIYYADW